MVLNTKKKQMYLKDVSWNYLCWLYTVQVKFLHNYLQFSSSLILISCLPILFSAIQELAALEEESASRSEKRPVSPSSNYRDKYSHLIGTAAAKDAAHTLQANRAYGCGEFWCFSICDPFRALVKLSTNSWEHILLARKMVQPLPLRMDVMVICWSYDIK